MTETPATPKARPPLAYYRWPMIILALIALQLILGAITVYFATNDPSFSVESDAHAKGLAWNETAKARRDSVALGWTHELRIGDPDPYGDRIVFITVTDAQGRPLADAKVIGEAYHQARGAKRLELSFRQVTPGLYRAPAKMRRDGLWVLQLVAQRGDDRYLIETKSYVGDWKPR